MLEAGLLWYKKFRSDLESIGFKFNPYDACVANRMVKGEQHTIRFHVDDVLSSHVDKKVNDDFGKWAQKTYGKLIDVTIIRGKVNEFLGMTLDFSIKGECHVKQPDHIKDMISEWPGVDFKKTVLSPVSKTLFKRGEGELLSVDQKELFHQTVAKGLFIACRSRPDITTTISVLTGRVRESSKSDQAKGKRQKDNPLSPQHQRPPFNPPL